ncbi:MAG TPA: ATP/GTP-binding protein [Candidatus Competibacteraceae bacterium]|nr:ATP/GTP-binding protein [Candidatus Competibacteraceae bacterium]
MTARKAPVNHHKIIFTGPVGAGKTTAIAAISDTPPLSTDARARDMTTARKATTTVAMDYGTLRLTEGERLHLYGTPGQERFNFMWDILSAGGLGLILLLDNTRSAPFQDLRFFTQAFGDFIRRTSLVIGITRCDLKPTPLLDDYRQELTRLGLRAPVFEVDARRRDDVSLLVQTLLYRLDPGLAD